VTEIAVRVIDVYAYRLTGASPEFLLLRRSEGVPYAGSWRMIGGKIGPREAAWQAALRELREEVGREPLRFWSVPSPNVFYEWADDRVNVVPVFAAEIDADPLLDDEHDAFIWSDAETASSTLRYPEQARLVRLVASLVEEGRIETDWLIEPEARFDRR
jgi:dihydroneopterin triphosphate diphosphatase